MEEDFTMEQLADRIAEKVIRGGMGERHGAEDGAAHHRATLDRMGGRTMRDEEFDDRAAMHAGPLAEIQKRIHGQARQMTEIAAKLNAHADRVHGHVPTEGVGGSRPVDGYAKGMPAVQAIMIALDDLDGVLSDVVVAAGRNSALA